MDYFVVPAKGISNRVPNKNTRAFAGSNLWKIAANLCASAGKLPIISSENYRVLEEAQELGFEVHLRKGSLVNAESSIYAVLKSLCQEKNLQRDDHLILIQPTSPLRSKSSLSDFIKYAEVRRQKTKFELMLSVTEDFGDFWYLKDNVMLRIRDSLPSLGDARESTKRAPLLKENGLYYSFSVKFLLMNCVLEKARVEYFISPQEEDLDINTFDEFKTAEYLYKERFKPQNSNS